MAAEKSYYVPHVVKPRGEADKAMNKFSAATFVNTHSFLGFSPDAPFMNGLWHEMIFTPESVLVSTMAGKLSIPSGIILRHLRS